MAVYSMTGYASIQLQPDDTTGKGGAARLGLELRSVNSRFLDLSLRLADELRAHEAMVRSMVGAALQRGKVEVRAFVDLGEQGALQLPASDALQRLASVQAGVRAWLPEAAALSVADALRLGGQVGAARQDWAKPLQQALAQALDALKQARAAEGERLAAMLLGRVQQLRALARRAEPMVPELVRQQRERFLERWEQAMQLSAASATPQAVQERALAEATAYAMRIDVAEEITRLDSHLDEIARLIEGGGEIGKRLDFLIQELHREANTLGSKSASMELTRISVDMKVLIEQMREQVQNIE
ncbi:YicC/YloC family endoribonuclease [Comamonas sp. NLF-1-9]|uniref:YicC/YloC family endoribonuclease n=1 Tax=Comamonas sp. NLF-1-9 TaxID=2853163 RepID=UPI001C43DF5C|nr:YicC/YloC family endoribonuclease [Comamonas sp. NLF-1-9]QXL85561.1 YicC family protein [Comamonas sp. NLF-1-9]